MDFMLSDADRVLISQVREFGKNYFNNESVAQWRRDMGLPDEVVKAFVDLDFNGFGVIHRRNHVHYDMLAQVLVLEELSRVSGATPARSKTISFSSRSSRLSRVLRKPTPFVLNIRIRDALHSLCSSEPNSGSETTGMKTSVRSVDGRLFMNGEKMFVNNGEYAPALLVAAIDEDAPAENGIPLVHVDGSAHRERRRGGSREQDWPRDAPVRPYSLR